MRRLVAVTLAALVVGMVIGAVVMWTIGPIGGFEVKVVEGRVTAVNDDATAIAITTEGGDNRGYVIAGAQWREDSLPWSDDFPTCIDEGATEQRVRLGVVDVQEQEDAPGSEVVVWFECLGEEPGPAEDISTYLTTRSPDTTEATHMGRLFFIIKSPDISLLLTN